MTTERVTDATTMLNRRVNWLEQQQRILWRKLQKALDRMAEGDKKHDILDDRIARLEQGADITLDHLRDLTHGLNIALGVIEEPDDMNTTGTG